MNAGKDRVYDREGQCAEVGVKEADTQGSDAGEILEGF